MPRWFRKKTFGLGWTPCTWQGWLMVAVFIVLTLAINQGLLGMTIEQRRIMILALIVPFIAATVFTSGKDSDS